MKRSHAFLLGVFALQLCACGASEHETSQKLPVQTAEMVAAPLVEDLHKAQTVQSVLQQGQDKTQAAIDANAQTGQ